MDVANQSRAKTAELAKITDSQHQPRRINPGLLDRVPWLEFDLLELPEEQQRKLFDIFHLELHYDRLRHLVTAQVTVYAETIDALRRAVSNPDDLRGRPNGEPGNPHILHIPDQRAVPGANPPGTTVADFERAPGGSRQASETAPTSEIPDMITIEGTWPLPPRGH